MLCQSDFGTGFLMNSAGCVSLVQKKAHVATTLSNAINQCIEIFSTDIFTSRGSVEFLAKYNRTNLRVLPCFRYFRSASIRAVSDCKSLSVYLGLSLKEHWRL